MVGIMVFGIVALGSIAAVSGQPPEDDKEPVEFKGDESEDKPQDRNVWTYMRQVLEMINAMNQNRFSHVIRVMKNARIGMPVTA